MDLVVLPVRKRVSSYGLKKAEMVKQLGENVWQCVEREKKNVSIANKQIKDITFEYGDWMWMHMRKERFLTQVRSNLQLLKGEGPFQVVE